MAAARKVPRSFDSYAKMEAANVVFVPGLALWLSRPDELPEILVLSPAVVAVAGFLIVGALYWRGVDRRLRGSGEEASKRALAVADRVEKPLLLVTLLATLAAISQAVGQGLTASVIAASVLTILAWLEYVNYYHRQLQHFDNVRDLKRLLTGRGLRRSHMARDLALFRGG